MTPGPSQDHSLSLADALDRSTLPDAFSEIPRLRDEMRAGRLALFLDFDGTLAPIVPRPEDAAASPAMVDAVKACAERSFVAAVSGRAVGDLAGRLGIGGLYLAGSHGFELMHPDGAVEAKEQAIAAIPAVDAIERALADTIGGLPGVQLERKRFGLAVHVRRASEEDAARVARAVEHARAEHRELKLKTGKKVYEFVPDLPWDKGRAVSWILEAAGLGQDRALPVFIGDDVTDEDGFAAVEAHGLGIAVGDDGPALTRARVRLDDVDDVARFLRALAVDA